MCAGFPRLIDATVGCTDRIGRSGGLLSFYSVGAGEIHTCNFPRMPLTRLGARSPQLLITLGISPIFPPSSHLQHSRKSTVTPLVIADSSFTLSAALRTTLHIQFHVSCYKQTHSFRLFPTVRGVNIHGLYLETASHCQTYRRADMF